MSVTLQISLPKARARQLETIRAKSYNAFDGEQVAKMILICAMDRLMPMDGDMPMPKPISAFPIIGVEQL